jgi:hypothetical protein
MNVVSPFTPICLLAQPISELQQQMLIKEFDEDREDKKSTENLLFEVLDIMQTRMLVIGPSLR